MSEAPEVKIVLCPFNMGRACMTTACRLWDETNGVCIFETMTMLLVMIKEGQQPPTPKKEPRKRPPKKEEPPKE